MVSILIADDNVYYARSLLNIINNNMDDIKVSYIAIDGKETLEIIEKEEVDIVVLNMKIPIYDGFHILNEIQEKSKDKYINSIIVISNETEMLNKVINKPYVFDTVNRLSGITEIIEKIKLLERNKKKELQEHIIKNKIIKQLQYLNYNLSHKGCKYLIDAIMIIYNSGEYDLFNLKEDVYPIIAKKYNKDVENIKNNINKANDYMYKVCKPDRIRRYFKFFDNSKPTVKNVIYTILNKIIEIKKMSL